jgi:phosphoglucosamine mutase
VTTKMSNLGLEHYLKSIKLELNRTDIGDRYVSQFMQKNGYNVGGEQSGHIILSDYSTTGDGIIAALQILAVMVEDKLPANKLCHAFEAYPQILKNVKISKEFDLNNENLVEIINKSEQKLKDKGRILVRKSGTEPLVRIMVEGKKSSEINKIADNIASEINNNAGDKLIKKPFNMVNNAWKNISDSWIRLRGGGGDSSR